MKRFLFSTLSAFALPLSAPLSAQSNSDEEQAFDIQTDEQSSQEVMAILDGMIGDLFPDAEPLTREQEARLPVAIEVVGKLLPEGLYARMMDETMRPMMDGMLGDLASAPIILLSQSTGMDINVLLDLDEKRLTEAAALFDPDAEKRSSETTAAFVDMITETVNEIEPAYRAGLARAYAVRFTKEELLDLNAYFATPVGAKYAGQNFLIFTDPQVMSTMNEMMPAMMERMPQMMESIREITEKYETGRTIHDLTDGERDRLAQLLGVTIEELEASAPPPPIEIETEAAYEET